MQSPCALHTRRFTGHALRPGPWGGIPGGTALTPALLSFTKSAQWVNTTHMRFDSTLFLSALGLAFVLEGLVWALFPRGMRRAMAQLTVTPSGRLRVLGLCSVGAGLLLVWLARH